MKRSLVKQGTSTLMVSLPSRWVKQFNLDKGDEVEVEEFQHRLIISGDKQKIRRETEIDIINNTETAIRALLINAYRTGYDLITVNFNSQDQLEIIKKIISGYTPGLELVSNTGKRCRIENLTEPSEEKFDTLFKNILLSISEMIKLTESRLETPQGPCDYESIMLKIHKYDNFCRRIILKRNLFQEKAVFFWNFLSLLVHGPRELYHLNKYLDKNKTKVHYPRMITGLNMLLESIHQVYFSRDLSKLETIHKLERELLFTRMYSLLPKTNQEWISLYHLGSAIRSLYLSTSPLSGFILEERFSTSPVSGWSTIKHP